MNLFPGAIGCFVIATRSKNSDLVPWYVGQTCRTSFEEEVFGTAQSAVGEAFVEETISARDRDPSLRLSNERYVFGFPSRNYGVRGKSGETRSMRQIGPPS